jgi:hypothetical protein
MIAYVPMPVTAEISMKQASSSTSSPSSPSNGRSSYGMVCLGLDLAFLPGDDKTPHMRGKKPFEDLKELLCGNVKLVDLRLPWVKKGRDGEEKVGEFTEGEEGLVTARDRGTAVNGSSRASTSRSGGGGRSKVVRKGEPRTVVKKPLKGGVLA